MGSGISHTLARGVGTITTDDGKVNALSPHMPGELNAALDLRAHVTTKLRARRALVESVTAAAEAEFGLAGAA
jgi:hypothetical protein